MEKVIKIFSIHVPLDDLTTILVILRRNKLCNIFFKTTWLCEWSGFGCAIDRQTSVKAANKNTELHKSCLEMGILLQTAMILLKCPFIQHISSWRLLIFLSLLLNEIRLVPRPCRCAYKGIRMCAAPCAMWNSSTNSVFARLTNISKMQKRCK